MNIELIRGLLLWCTIINYGVLLVWLLVFTFAHEWMRLLHGRWFHFSDESFDAIHYAGMTLYKVGILLLNLIPYIALSIVVKYGF